MTILLVDDIPTNRKLLFAILQAAGYTTREASDGEEALRLLERSRVDAVISDILMPRMDGFRLCYEVRKSRKYSTIPFIVLTATYTSPGDEKLAFELGADKVLKKPVSSDDLLQNLDEVLHDPTYTRPRIIRRPREIEVIREYTDALVAKLEEKNAELQKRTEDLKQLSSAVEQTADSIVITDKEGVIEYVNPAFETSTGFTKELALGKTPRILKSGMQPPGFYQGLWKTILLGSVFRGEFINRRRNGELYIEQQTISPILDDNGEIIHFVSAGKDITERKQMEEKLAAALGQLNTLFDNLDEVFFSFDVPNRKLLQISSACEKVFGLTDSALLENPDLWREVIHPEDIARIETRRKNVELVQTEYRILRPDDSTGWVESKLKPILDGTGKVVRIDGLVADVTRRKESEEALKLQSRVLENMSEAVLITDEQGTIILANSACEEMFGYRKGELIGENSFNLVDLSDERYRNLIPAVVKGLRTSGSWKDELRNLKKDGSSFNTQAFIGSIEPEGKHFWVMEDITEKKRVERHLQQTQKLESLGTLAGGIAHDFNNLLGIIMGHASLLESARGDHTRLMKATDTITKSALRGAGLVRQLLTFARKTEVTLESVLINNVVTEVVKLIEETFPRVITISTSLQGNLPSIVADVTQVHQVLLNLCVNARDAMIPHGGTITITTRLVARGKVWNQFPHADALEYVLLGVADTGTGMDDSTRLRIFEPFFTTKEQGKGTGLGLATVYGIMTSHHGFIGVESEIGKGTTFSAYFPVSLRKVETVEEEPESLSQIPGGTETLLVVEDELMLKEFMSIVLQDKGYNVLAAEDGVEAIAKFSQSHEQIKLVISDLGLPRLGGEPLVQGLKEIDPSVKVIVASGYLDPEIRAQLVKAGVMEFVHKPFRPAELLRKVRQTLDRTAGWNPDDPDARGINK